MLSGRAVSRIASEIFPKLGLSANEPNLGVFSGGKWCGNGALMKSINPSTGEELATVQTVNHLDLGLFLRRAYLM